MMTFEDIYTKATTIVSDTSATNVTFMKALVNETQKNVCGLYNWHFLESTFTTNSTSNQQTITLPVDCIRLKTYRLDSGRDVTPREIADPIEFDKINSEGTNVTSNYPQYFHIRNGGIVNFPTITTAGLSIKLEYLAMPKDMTMADYTEGTIVSISNGGTEVVGTDTLWGSISSINYRNNYSYRNIFVYRQGSATNTVVGESILMPDGLWYEIASIVDETHLTLVKPYQGSTVVSGSAAYRIGELPVVPEPFHDLLWYRPVGIYLLIKGELEDAQEYFGMYESGIREMRRSESTKTTDLETPETNISFMFNQIQNLIT